MTDLKKMFIQNKLYKCHSLQWYHCLFYYFLNYNSRTFLSTKNVAALKKICGSPTGCWDFTFVCISMRFLTPRDFQKEIMTTTLTLSQPPNTHTHSLSLSLSLFLSFSCVFVSFTLYCFLCSYLPLISLVKIFYKMLYQFLDFV